VNRSFVALYCLLLIASPPVFAQTSDHRSSDAVVGNQPSQHNAKAAPQLRHAMRDEINTGLVGIISRGMEGTELWEATDLAASLGGTQDHLRILPIAGKGGVQNATDILFARGIDIGIIQTDVLAALKNDPPFPGIDNYLKYVTKLYDEELHVLTGWDVHSVEDLASKKVNFGAPGSGTFATATAVFRALGVAVDVTDFPQPVALQKLRRGEISAMVCLTPKPARLFQDLRPDEDLHFLSIRAGSGLPRAYTSATLTAEDYPDLIEANAPVSTVAVGTILAAYNWPAGTERYRKVARFVEAFFARLQEMQVPPHHPKWHEIDLAASVPGWTRFPAAEQWIKKAESSQGEARRQAAIPQPSTGGLTEQERNAIFAEFVDYQKRMPALDPQRREALFREFAEYSKRQGGLATFERRAAQFAANQN